MKRSIYALYDELIKDEETMKSIKWNEHHLCLDISLNDTYVNKSSLREHDFLRSLRIKLSRKEIEVSADELRAMLGFIARGNRIEP